MIYSYYVKQSRKSIFKWAITQPRVQPEMSLLAIHDFERSETHKNLLNIHQTFPEMGIYCPFYTTP